MSCDVIAKSITIVCGFTLLFHYLPFGSSHCPNLWCMVSELITALGNELFSGLDWNGRDLFSPHVSKLKGTKLLPDDHPFGLLLTPDVLIPPVPCGRIDDFIDDLVTSGFASDN